MESSANSIPLASLLYALQTPNNPALFASHPLYQALMTPNPPFTHPLFNLLTSPNRPIQQQAISAASNALKAMEPTDMGTP